MNTCERSRPIAFSMLLSSWPARPTKGSPCASSSAPGASPIDHPLRLAISDAENGLRARFLQAAQRAAGDGPLQRLPVHERHFGGALRRAKALLHAACLARHIPVDAELLQV